MYKDLDAARKQKREWMRQYRRDHPEKVRASRQKARKKVIEQAKKERLIPVSNWAAARWGAKKRGLEWAIEREDYPIPVLCPALGIPLDWSSYDNTPSLDRVDNEKGYVPGNVVVVSRRANRIKSAASVDELIKMGKFYERWTV